MKIITQHPKIARTPPAAGEPLPFGRIFAEYMFVMDFADGSWQDAKLMPFGQIELSPAATVFHYAQEVFEGLKAYRTDDGQIVLFRPQMNAARAAASCSRLCMPPLSEADFILALDETVKANAQWIPHGEGESLYLRPFMIGTDAALGVHPAENYRFMIIACPVGSYYKNGLQPASIYIESDSVRAVRGGTGEAKTGGNYAASLQAGDRAAKNGYDQVLWLDGVDRRYIEEVGAMNIFFVIDGTVVTPSLSGSILHGVTRDSCLKLCEKFGIPCCERRITAAELYDAARSGALSEAFGCGTAAVISPIGAFGFGAERLNVGNGGIGPLTRRFYDALCDIQRGRASAPAGWLHEVR